MYYNMETLSKIATNAELNINLSYMGPRIKTAVIRNFNRGYSETLTGEAALYYALLADQFELPCIQYSKKSQWYSRLFMKNIDSKCKPQLSEWWDADRVTYRLKESEEYNRITSSHNHWLKDDLLHQPDWEVITEESKVKPISIPIFSKDLKLTGLITESYIKDKYYVERKEKAIHMIESNQTIKVNYVF